MVTKRVNSSLEWQTKAVLLLVLPWTAADTVLQSHWWAVQVPIVAWTVLGICAIFGLIVWRLRAGTPGAAITGACITASLMYATTRFPYRTSWLHGGLFPLLSLFLLTFAATKLGKAKKERLGTAESKRGRNAAQVAANLGVAALIAQPVVAVAAWLHLGSSLGPNSQWLAGVAAMAALAEAAADTVSSEIGQVVGGTPRLITTLRKVEPGTDGGITNAGTLAGALAAAIVAAVAAFAFQANWIVFSVIFVGGVFGLLLDSLLGAIFERRGWLNNDAVNFLSTAGAALFVFAEVVGATLLQHR